MNRLKTMLLVSIFALSVSGAYAAPVNFTLVGTVGSAATPNAFGLNVGDSITVSGIFDGNVLSGVGAEGVVFSLASGNSLNIDAGLMSFTEADDVNYGLGSSPKLSFLDGSFNGFDFLTYFGTSGQFESTIFSAGALDDNFNVVNSTWTNYTVSSVPVPAAVWLFGSGLLGLAGVARRKR